MERRKAEGSHPDTAARSVTGRAIVVGPYLRSRRGDADNADASSVVRDTDARLEEITGLARAIDLTVVEAVPAPISQIRPATRPSARRTTTTGGAIQ